MDLDLTPDQEALVEAARAVLTAECPPAAARARTEALLARHPRPPDLLWDRAVELGWCALAVPEAHGGVGLGAVETALLAEELGRALAPGPLLPTLAALTPALRESAEAESPAAAVAGERLAAVATGACTGTLAVAEAGGTLDPAAWRTTAVPTTGGSVRLSGEKEMVWEAPTCGELVVGAVDPDGEPGVYLVPAAATTVEEVATADGSRTFARVRLDGVEVTADRVLAPPGPGAGVLERVVQHATLAVAMDAVGAAAAAFEATVAYAREREQFGRPIGAFQAIKHKAADMLVALERARALGRFAALCVAEGDGRRALAVAMAKAAAGDAGAKVGRETIQVHGGIGFTWEHDAHLYVRRLLADDALFGPAPAQRARVADLLGL